MLGIIALIATLFILLNVSKVQNYVAQRITKSLSEKLQTTVSVGSVDYRLFNTFKFNDLYIQDLKKDTLLYARSGYLDFNFRRLFEGKIIFNELRLDRLEGNLVTDTAGVNNLDFIIRAFKKPKKKQEPSPVEFNFRDIRITNSSFKLHNLQRKALSDAGKFDINRLTINDINARIAVDYFSGDSLKATILSLSAREKSGLTVENLSTQIQGFKNGHLIV